MVIWITGLSGTGKTTLCEALRALIKSRLAETVVLDGDVIRALFDTGLGYREQDRVVQIGRIQALAKLLSDQGLVVIVGALYAHPDLLSWNREKFGDYFEVYLEASIEFLRGRDSKGLYARAAAGEVNVVGVDIPWHAPLRPDMTIDASASRPAGELARELADAVPRLHAALADPT